MDEKMYTETVLQEVHRRTMVGDLNWKVTDTSLHAEPVSSIAVTIRYEDLGPDSATWVRMAFTHPVGNGTASITAPTDPLARYAADVASGKTLEMIDDLFQRLVLTPRRKQFDETMAKLTRR